VLILDTLPGLMALINLIRSAVITTISTYPAVERPDGGARKGGDTSTYRQSMTPDLSALAKVTLGGNLSLSTASIHRWAIPC
jgi:hypothetical protein